MPIEEAKKFGTSNPRNKTIHSMFTLINIGERAGSGIPNIITASKEANFNEPLITQDVQPDEVIVTVYTTNEVIGSKNEPINEPINEPDPEPTEPIKEKDDSEYDGTDEPAEEPVVDPNTGEVKEKSGFLSAEESKELVELFDIPIDKRRKVKIWKDVI